MRNSKYWVSLGKHNLHCIQVNAVQLTVARSNIKTTRRSFVVAMSPMTRTNAG